MTGSPYSLVVGGGWSIWWSEKTPTEITLASSDPRFYSENTGPGLQFTASSNPRSANYHPANFNRFVRALRDAGKKAPEEVVEGERRLDRRNLAARPPVVIVDGIRYRPAS